MGEGEISYAGASAYERAQLAGDIVEKRLNGKIEDLRIDFIGLNSAHRANFSEVKYPKSEIRLRVAGKSKSPAQAAFIGEEVEALYTNGPAGGGGVRKYVTEVIGIISVLTDRNNVSLQINLSES